MVWVLRMVVCTRFSQFVYYFLVFTHAILLDCLEIMVTPRSSKPPVIPDVMFSSN